MVQVRIWGSLAAATEDQTTVEIEASTLRELLDGLAARYPAIRPQLDRGVSVAIDGRIYNDSWFQPIKPDSEVVLLARLKGG
jgi:molybdopterin converting factor small subunit